jgi:hypothetical protein
MDDETPETTTTASSSTASPFDGVPSIGEFRPDNSSARDAVEAARDAERQRTLAAMERALRENLRSEEQSYLGGAEMRGALTASLENVQRLAREAGFPLAGLTVAEYVDAKLAVLRVTNRGSLEDAFNRTYNIRALNERATGVRDDAWTNSLGVQTRLWWPYHDLMLFTFLEGFYVTSTTGDSHLPTSYHYSRRSVDSGLRLEKPGGGYTLKSPAEVDAFMNKARWLGVFVLDERLPTPASPHRSGPHLHLDSRYYAPRPPRAPARPWAADSVRQRSGDDIPPAIDRLLRDQLNDMLRLR